MDILTEGWSSSQTFDMTLPVDDTRWSGFLNWYVSNSLRRIPQGLRGSDSIARDRWGVGLAENSTHLAVSLKQGTACVIFVCRGRCPRPSWAACSPVTCACILPSGL